MILRERPPDPERPGDRALLGRPFRESLRMRIGTGDWAGRVLTIGSRPAGIVLLDLRGEGALVLDWRVLPVFRRAGLGGRLLDWAAEEAVARGKPRLRLVLPSGSPSHRILDRRGWAPPSRRILLFHADSAAPGHPWVGPSRFRSLEAVPWLAASPWERRIVESPPPGAAPPPPPIGRGGWEPKASGILRKNGRPIGWLLAEQWGSGTVHVASAWVDPSCERTGGLLCLVRLFLASVHGPTVSWSVDSGNERFLTWIKRRWRPLGATAGSLEQRTLFLSPAEPDHRAPPG